jgi:hypothetical protein
LIRAHGSIQLELQLPQLEFSKRLSALLMCVCRHTPETASIQFEAGLKGFHLEMKTLGIIRLGAFAFLFSAQINSASAVTFIHDSFISIADFSDDGQDIVVTNCTLTVDGAHAFNSVQVLNGAVLTHSPFPYGAQQYTSSVFDEAHMLSATNPATLNYPAVDAGTIVVMDDSLSITYTENVDYVLSLSNDFTQLTLTTNSAIAEGATVLVNYDWVQSFQGFNLTISNNLLVAGGGAINVTGKGYAGGIGFANGAGASRGTNYPFAFTAGSGGAHGGNGGMSSTFARGGVAYDSTTTPAILGSGGGRGTADGGGGGGVASLFVGGNLEIDGQFLANGLKGTNAHSGGGAGGSVLVSAQRISGAGIISANGGGADSPDGGGGGGGRIAIYFATNDFTGNILASGGTGATAGGAGTIYLKSMAEPSGQLLIVNGGKRGANTLFSTTAIHDLTISGGAIAQPQDSSVSLTNLFVGSNSWLISPDSSPLLLAVGSNATVESDARISADFKSLSGSGTGSASCGNGSGGGYGGYGGDSACGAPGGGPYGSITQPVSFGGAGGGGTNAGGGAIQMTVLGTLSLAGDISANGASAATLTGGGGSGGSVWLTVGTLDGAGIIAANGGSANNLVGGGGSGGRVAVYYDHNLFTGDMAAHGGAGVNAGGAGSVYLQSITDATGRVIIDNGGLAGFSLLSNAPALFDLQISGGAVLTNSGPTVTVRDLFIGSNSWFTALPGSFPNLNIVATSATLQPNGGLTTDGDSSATPGAGGSANLTGGGGGNGGNGGASATNAPGGTASGSYISPNTAGALGGFGLSGPGGKGGGVISLAVRNKIQLDGKISANGVTGPALNSGGGAGGSISVSAATISGAGTISANGGDANDSSGLGGGGGGGRIAISYVTNSFTGAMTAFGGAGANDGGAGTLYLKRSSPFEGLGQLIIDNGGPRGAVTPLLNPVGTFDLTVTGGGVLSNTFSTTLQLGNLLVGSNGTLRVYPLSAQLVNVTSNATVLAGGSINADGVSLNGSGQGQTFNGTGGGGGAAGTGGPSALNAAGGNAVQDSIILPQTLGSRGGSGNQGSGGNGGGSLRMAVGQTLRVDGRISVEGATSSALNSGGGSGGTVWLSAKTFSGNGTVSVNGGAGNAAGGGGGAGRIAISSTTNLFTGSLTARGGSGANYGGAGTIYISGINPLFAGPFSPSPQLILDNGGVSGGYTPFSSIPSENVNLIVTGGAIMSNSFSMTPASLFIGSNSTWLASSTARPIVTVLSNTTIQAGGRITSDGIISTGPNPGLSLGGTGGGGGHGGNGGMSLSNALGGGVTLDSFAQPNSAGSRGGSGSLNGPGGNGGGAFQVTVRGSLQLDGRLSADGSMSPGLNGGGGSGGAIWLTVGKLLGSGSISANGGAGNNAGGGGGGGRISLWYNTNLFSGSITARGGGGANPGGAGTFYTTASTFGQSKFSQLVVDNGGTRGNSTSISSEVGGFNFTISNGASVALSSSQLLWNSLVIASNSSLRLASNLTAVTVTISSNLTIQPGGVIALDGQGFPANNGTGHGSFNPALDGAKGGGAGHGGYGSVGEGLGALGGMSYDSITTPTMPGSGGGAFGGSSGSMGGGALHLIVNGVLAVNGVLSANGTAGIASGTGGGSGGSLWLSAGTISGSGRISADGGDGELFGSGGGGSGGRIATYFTSNKFTGTLSARGGAGPFLYGGAGTIYLKTNSANFAELILDNHGARGTNTPLDFLTTSNMNLSVSNGAAASAGNALTLQNMLIGPDGIFNANSLAALNLTVRGNASVSQGGAINADAAGDNSGALPGAGGVDSFGDGGGGGYGGAGGASFFGEPGGGTYGVPDKPTSFGSAGGVYPALTGFSQGGGAIRLAVSGAISVNGNISANGNDGVIDGSGGGSGGSIWITAQTFSGNGSLNADGGRGESSEGGGGGGGRIAVYAITNLFAGNFQASGGDGAFPGQDGTIDIITNIMVSGSVLQTNGAGVAGLPLQASGLPVVLTDSRGFYSVTVPSPWTGTIAPEGSIYFLPNARSYSDLAGNTTNQNFLLASGSDFNLSAGQFDGTNLSFNWYGISGVTYQTLSSSNLVDWVPYGPPIMGNNAPLTLTVPPTNAPQLYFRLGVSY